MRYGSVDVQDLSKEVLAMAEYLVLERLVRAAKLLLARHCGIYGPTEELTLQQLNEQKDLSSSGHVKSSKTDSLVQLCLRALSFTWKSHSNSPLSTCTNHPKISLEISVHRLIERV
jgi:hypothetical protein